MQRVLEPGLHFALVLIRLHVDKVDHDQTTQIAQSHLAGCLIRGLDVRAHRGLFDVTASGRARRVDVDSHQGLGVINHNGAARGQGNDPRMGCFDLMFDLEAGKQGHIVAVALHTSHVVGHDHRHEGSRLFENLFGIDQDFTDIRREVIADRSNHKTRFEVDQHGCLVVNSCRFNRTPELK